MAANSFLIKDRLAPSRLNDERGHGFSFNDCNQGSLMIFADHCLEFPVAGACSFINHRRSIVNLDAVRNLSATIFGFYAFAALFPTKPEMPVQFASPLLIIENEVVDGFVIDGGPAFGLQTTAGLFGTPVIFKPLAYFVLGLYNEMNIFLGGAAS